VRRVVHCVAGLVVGAALLSGCGPDAGTTAGSGSSSASSTPGPTASETSTTPPPATGTVDVQLALDRIAEAQSCEALTATEEVNGREYGSPEELAAVQPADLARREALHCEVWTDPVTGLPALRSAADAQDTPDSEVQLAGVQPLKPVAVSTHDKPTIGPFDCVPVPDQNTAQCSATNMVTFTLYESIVDRATMEARFPDLLSSATATATPGVLCNGPTYGDAGGGMACFEKVGPDVFVMGYTTYLPSLGADTVAYLTHDVALGQ